MKTIQKVGGIELIKKSSDENLNDEPKRSKPENNKEEEEDFNYFNEDNKDNFPFPSGDDDEDSSPSSEKINKIEDYLYDIRQNDEQKDQRLLARKTARKKKMTIHLLEKLKKISLKKVSD